MASPSVPILIISSLLLSSLFSNALTSPKAFIFPIRKDGTTNQYYTTIQIGSNATTLNVGIDLGGNFLWFNSLDYFSAADTYRPILCGTKRCQIANLIGCVFCFSAAAPGCSNNTCADWALNPFTGTNGYSGLSTDVMLALSTRGTQYKLNFPFQYSDPILSQGLATPTAGLLALGRTRLSLQSQLSSAFKIRNKLALCIPPSGGNGYMIAGQEVYREPFRRISESMWTTPLLRNPWKGFGDEVIGNLSNTYFIGVKSIRVGGTSLALNKTLLSIDKVTGEGGTSLRTVRAYTSLHGSIYAALVEEFVKAAAGKGMKRVASVAPFGACFDSKTIKSGGDVPTVDLILQRKKVYWRFYGWNTMVRVGKGVMCLAFVEGEPNTTGPTTSIVVAGYQLENHLLEFDVPASKLGFSSSLLLRGTSCKEFGAAALDPYIG
ncbi:probable aspartic proteinase GIP2 [Salvia miltiorrhiza]|uniref:probable aspartic proteinase GIP2 n=1 Tax=Salvia miltiorrhiza TaxID=226208 RepID=UPI0025ABC225|nr:probable aspartic proteinase GIP2 [Salvia miltiorrhiza]